MTAEAHLLMGFGDLPGKRVLSPMSWWQRRSVTVRDAVGAIPIVLLFVLVEQISGDGGSVARAIAVVLVMGLALSFRRRWPIATFAAALLTVAVAMTGLAFLAVASYTLVAYDARARPTVVVGMSALASTIGFMRWWPAFVLPDVAGDLAILAVVSVQPVVVGRAVRASRLWTAELESRNSELVALRGTAAEHAVRSERLRIARELHDVVAHHVSALTVRARAGHHVADRDPQAAVDALAYVAGAGTKALTAMGAFVGTLRGEAKTARGQGDLAPQPDLGDIAELLESYRSGGLVVHAELGAVPDAVAPAESLNAYRIVQEALTNVLRHAAAERAWVRVWCTADMLHIQVDDNGRGLRANRPEAGHGLIGVAERAALHAGTAVLGASPRGGCRLEATLTVGHGQCPDPEAVDAGAVGA